ncbi:DUF2237 family protein [Dokdonia sp. Asnod2-E02]|uniref:DUF2237 family protein n=1 Tax=Dokdonia sp. Asnod2-E02 TaxID=3160574 RepID=UPI003864CFBA
MSHTPSSTIEYNVYGETLIGCCTEPMTGYFRDGYCRTASIDRGTHVVCAVMTEAFLNYTKTRGNDLSTPIPQYNFPGLKPNDGWCLCIMRWLEAEKAGVAPLLNLAATHQKALEYTTIEVLEAYAL